jgi:hypothetical protein
MTRASDAAAAAKAKWANSAGTGDRTAVWALTGVAGRVVHRAGFVMIMISFPIIAVML